MANLAALRAAFFRYLRKTSGGGAEINPPAGARVNACFQPCKRGQEIAFRLLVRKIHSHNNLLHEKYQLAPKMGQVEILTSLYFFRFYAQVVSTFPKIMT